MNPLVSIIIPCYNSGEYLSETIDSIVSYTGKHKFEIVIVDDGSNEVYTLNLLKKNEDDRIRIIYQQNGGPAAARNTGVINALSDVIIFLDSDNKLRSSIFIDEGLAFLSFHPEVGVVYGNAETFGVSKTSRFTSAPFDLVKLLAFSYIDMCAMVRKQTWLDVGGMDEARLLIGHEDWDFWLRIARTNWKFHYINEVLFDYRIVENSLITQASQPDKYQKMREYVLAKHIDLLSVKYRNIYDQFQLLATVYKENRNAPVKTFMRNILHKFKVKDSRMWFEE